MEGSFYMRTLLREQLGRQGNGEGSEIARLSLVRDRDVPDWHSLDVSLLAAEAVKRREYLTDRRPFFPV
jgi:hypothetical protein